MRRAIATTIARLVRAPQEARHLWVALQPRHQAAGQGGLSRRLLIPQDPLLHQAGLVPGNAVLDKA